MTTGLAILCVLALVAAPATGGTPTGDRPDQPEWRDLLNCGPNCLYMLLKLKGKAVDYRTVRDAIEVGPSGSSFDQIRKAAARFGVDGSVVRCGVNDLTSALPAIVHMDMLDGSEGHFVLLLGVDKNVFYVVETSNAEVVPLPRAMFLKNWTGVAFVTRRGSHAGAWPATVGALAALAALAAAPMYFALRRGHRPGRALA